MRRPPSMDLPPIVQIFLNKGTISMSDYINRRTFIKTTAAASASFSVLQNPISCEEEKEQNKAGDKKSRVVEVAAPGVVLEKRKLDYDRAKQMVDKGILALTGKKDLPSAWACFVKPDDIVGIKLNACFSGFGGVITAKKPIVRAVVEGVKSAGVPEKNIIIWDQIKETLMKYYVKHMKMDEEFSEVTFEGCAPRLRKEHYMEGKPLDGFTSDPIVFPWGKVKIADLITKKLTAIINIPILKDHACSGVTLSLKNISHAVVDIPWHCHENCCDPYIADIVNIPVIKDKLRLHILDGIFGVAEGGPPLLSFNHLFVKESLLLSADPVAVDSLGLKWVEAARKKMGFCPLEEAENKIELEKPNPKKGRPAIHIATAAARGLGTNDPKMIDLVKVDIPKSEKAPAEEKEG